MIRKIRNIVLVLFMVGICITLSGCKIKSYAKMNHITYENILNQKGDYLVFIYGNNCEYCEELKPLMCKYANLAKKNSEYMPLYVINSSNTQINNGLIASGGDESFDDFTGTNDYKMIHISTTPALIIVKDGKVSRYISSKLYSNTTTRIRNYITGLIK